MNAIVQLQDKDIVRLLVDSKASLTQQNARGETAETLAKKNGMEQALRPKGARNTIRARVIDTIVSMVLLIIAYANSLTSGAVPEGIVKKLYNIRGIKDEELAKVSTYLSSLSRLSV